MNDFSFVVNIENKTISRKELADLMGYEESTIKRGGYNLPPSIDGSNNMYYLPVVISWFIQHSNTSGISSNINISLKKPKDKHINISAQEFLASYKA